MVTKVKDSAVQQTIREHEDLHRRMEAIRKQAESASAAVAAGARGPQEFPVGRLVGALQEFHDRLSAHFSSEEASGLPEDLALRLPHVADKAHALRRGHGRILEEMRALLEQGRAAQSSSAEEMSRYGERIRLLLDDVVQHEESENDLIQDAYLGELGVSD